ncbi:hypothetical protein [Kitasatospora cineracea]|uniref:Uncharacterized protein n=1 Tax=Kitasatospora cineracea TaxID=88074 RepID=A0A8G1X8E0_9ACTN|nr:hypothetical protein [Kitasatospora cineracea]ROR37667.1 hypothetical protein EDD39_5818 [Kitasatospora cineracea]
MIVENGPGAGRPERYGWGPSGRRLAEQGRWDELLERFRLARALGDPLSGPLGHLLAYGAPAALAARLFDPDGGPGAPATAADHDAGPLWEVLATRHPRAVLDALPLPPPIRRLAVHTRALLGEDPGADLDPAGVPYRLQPWRRAAGSATPGSASTCPAAAPGAPCTSPRPPAKGSPSSNSPTPEAG